MPRRSRAARFGLLLAPGASAGRDQPALVAIDAAASAAGVAVRRMEFAYHREGRRAPDRAEVLMAEVANEAAALAEEAGLRPEEVVLGGRSMGGRICSMAAAGGLATAGLVLVSYPLHPPGRPERLRTEHFAQLTMPCLFVSGSKDAFGTPEELRTALGSIPGPVSVQWLEGGDHGLRRRDGEVAGLVVSWLAAREGLRLGGARGTRA